MTAPAPPVQSVRRAARFLWAWLILAASASVGGNVAYALLTAPAGAGVLAAAASVVPPVVLLGSTHSVAVLVRANQTNRMYWCALLTTVSLAGCAFVLSFDALSGLAEMAGMRSERAWLWPCAIDLSIAQSTLALLVITGASRRIPLSPTVDVGEANTIVVHRDSSEDGALVSVDADASADADDVHGSSTDVSIVTRWHPTARQLIDAGVTQKDVDVVALVLAEHEAGTAPSTIGRRLDVHHSTVGRILARAAELT
ncbi:helix-turn-helix domain-containing protein [Mycolicibacterium sp. P1-18]|uniref:helix-turn-helix domain-containing protein n=1 Tax=Mycolicibacterium sp. P1-18 TaxID=2024615 RepID=UPI0015631D12|nr:helix-turn-helix domain-containing protein [Mycolicibacterium sp. P1-18]